MGNKKTFDESNLKQALFENNQKIKEFVENKTNNISIAQKTINEELEYGIAYIKDIENRGMTGASFTWAVNDVVPFSYLGESNIKYDSKNNYAFTLSAGKTYNIRAFVRRIDVIGYIYFGIYDLTNNKYIGNPGCIEGQNSVNDASCEANAIITPDTNIQIQIKIESSSNQSYSSYNLWINSYFVVQEIGRIQTIDSVEYINTTQGIEDTPVGHIISHMGNAAPKHYLICDGTEYNVADYPYLAQHFKNEFGSYNYFGGDGLNTFCVPDLRGEFLRGTGTATRDTGNGSNVGIHQDGTEIPYFWSLGTKDGGNLLVGAGNGINSVTVKNLDKNNIGNGNKYISSNITVNNSIEFTQTYTSRPTNTSVLYCIKYEPTYYMTVGQYTTVQGFEDLTEEELNNLITDTINLLNK